MPHAHFDHVVGHFLNLDRRILAIGAIAVTAGFASFPNLPASAEIVQAEVIADSAQTFTAPAIVPVVHVARDAFGVSSYSLVQWPLPSTTEMADGYGWRSCAGCSAFHEGIDLDPGYGYPVEAIADGVVVESEFSGALGAHVIIENNIDGQIIRSLYGHMQGDSLTVAVGQTVTRGQVLGLVGSTGQSTGPHLHFAIQIGDTLIDPLPWLQQHANSDVLPG
jgi:murein DD-endopeptidase MepM/ murein hydrolase activator NlpD